jgi:hypothetical protein
MILDVDIFENPKIDGLLEQRNGAQAVIAYFELLAWAVRNLTDGYLPARAIRLCHRATPALARQLVESGLLVEYGDGWSIPDFLEYQKSASSWIAEGEKRSKSGSKGNCRRWHDDRCRCLEGHPPIYREKPDIPIAQAIAQAIEGSDP